MATPTKKILFVSHEASLSGAPVLLLNLISLLKERHFTEPGIVVARGGVLNEQFAQLAKTIVVKEQNYSAKKPGWSWLTSRLKMAQSLIKIWQSISRYDVIFANSIVAGSLVKLINWRRLPVITYVHELSGVIDFYHRTGQAQKSLQHSTKIASPSRLVANTLVRRYSVAAVNVLPLNYYIPPQSVSASMHQVCRDAGILHIYGVGLASERKGTDTFIEVAKLAQNRYPFLKFHWVGDWENEKIQHQYLRNNRDAYGMACVTFHGAVSRERMPEIFEAMDILLLTSREDPYPVVVLEAAEFARPCITHRDSGGITDFVDGVGWIAPMPRHKRF